MAEAAGSGGRTGRLHLRFAGPVVALLLAVVALAAEAPLLQVFDEDVTFVRLPHRLRRDVTEAAWWANRYAAGDRTVDPDRDVRRRMEDVRTLLATAHSGGESDMGPLPRTTDAPIVAALDAMADRAEAVRRAIEDRLRDGTRPPPGAPTQDSLTLALRELHLASDSLVAATLRVRGARWEALRWFYRGAVLGILALSLLAAALSERNRRALEASERHLITRVEEATADLRREEARLATILDATIDGLVLTDTQGAMEWIAPSTRRIFGIAAGEGDGANLRTLLEPGDGDAVVRWFPALDRGGAGRVERGEFQGRRADGTPVPLAVAARRIELGSGPRVLLTIRDISERRRAQEERDLFFRVSVDLLCVANLDGRFVRVNTAFTATLGWSEEELLAVPFMDRVHPEDREATGAEMARLAAGQPTIRFANRFRCRDGSWRWLEWMAFPIPARGLVFASARDVTEQRAATAELHAARDVAEAATRAKSAFLAHMSHEFRTPMNAVVGMTGLLLETPLDPLQWEYASTARTGAETLLTLIDDVLDFSKIESGRLELERIPVDLAATCEEALDLVAAQAGAKGLRVACVIEPEVPASVLGDPVRLRQVLVNLLANAVKFTAKGEVILTARMTPGTGDAARVALAVRDTGIGISAEGRERLFRSFSQVDSSTTRRHGGTGLGLAISRALVEMMGGTLRVESEPGSGSTFTAELPVALAPAPAPERPVPPPLAGRRVLVADPHGPHRRSLALRLRAFGAEVLEAADRDAATRAAGIPDLHAALADGDLVESIRAAGPSALPVLLLAPPGGEAAAAAAAGIPRAHVLRRPARSTSLLAAVTAAVSGALPESDGLEFRTPPPLGRPAPGPRRLRILVAEDNPANRTVIQRLLEHLGERCDFAADGVEAVAAAAVRTYDLILMDMQMPRMDGVEAAAAIRDAAGPRAPRIVAVTANVGADDRAACAAAGMSGYLTKPVRVDALRAILEESPVQIPDESAARSAGSGEPLVDPARVAALRELNEPGEPDLFGEVAALFLSEFPRRLDEARAAARSGDAETLYRAAHAIKGSAVNIGAVRLANLAEAIEKLGRANVPSQALPPLERLVPLAAETEAALRQAMDEFKG